MNGKTGVGTSTSTVADDLGEGGDEGDSESDEGGNGDEDRDSDETTKTTANDDDEEVVILKSNKVAVKRKFHSNEIDCECPGEGPVVTARLSSHARLDRSNKAILCEALDAQIPKLMDDLNNADAKIDKNSCETFKRTN